MKYNEVESGYFESRRLRRHARVGSLWALGVGAVISGDFFGWNFGLAAGGFGGLLIATGIITLMYAGLCFSIAEMSPALPHTGGAYSFARSALGPWGGFITGLAESIEYIMTPAVIVFFIGSYLTGIFETPAMYQPLWWIACYLLFVALNYWGVELSFKISVIVTLLNTLLSCSAGASPPLSDHLVELLNRNIMPAMPRHASIGAGDLVAMAALPHALIGEGEVLVEGARRPAREAQICGLM